MSVKKEGVGAAFGLVLKNARKTSGLSQEALAEKSRLDRTFISLLERGLRQPSLKTIFDLSPHLGVSPSEMVSLVEAKLRRRS